MNLHILTEYTPPFFFIFFFFRIKPRHFSIASAAVQLGSAEIDVRDEGGCRGSVPEPTLELCVARVQWKTRYGRLKRGLASSWLCDASIGQKLVVLVRQGPARTLVMHKCVRCVRK